MLCSSRRMLRGAPRRGRAGSTATEPSPRTWSRMLGWSGRQGRTEGLLFGAQRPGLSSAAPSPPTAHSAEECQVHLPGQQGLPCGQAAQEPLPVLPLPEVPGRRHGQRRYQGPVLGGGYPAGVGSPHSAAFLAALRTDTLTASPNHSGPDRQPEGAAGPSPLQAQTAARCIPRQPHHLAGAGTHRLHPQCHQARLLQGRAGATPCPPQGHARAGAGS